MIRTSQYFTSVSLSCSLTASFTNISQLNLTEMFAAVRPICLPDPGQDYDNVSALVTGWGRTSSSGPQSNILQEATLRTMTNRQCRSSSHRHDRITENMICAGAADRDSCRGDSGGPLAVEGQDGSYSQIGIVSWGKGCARQGYPGVYTRLTALLPWLKKIMNSKPGKQLFSRTYLEFTCGSI